MQPTLNTCKYIENQPLSREPLTLNDITQICDQIDTLGTVETEGLSGTEIIPIEYPLTAKYAGLTFTCRLIVTTEYTYANYSYQEGLLDNGSLKYAHIEVEELAIVDDEGEAVTTTSKMDNQLKETIAELVNIKDELWK